MHGTQLVAIVSGQLSPTDKFLPDLLGAFSAGPVVIGMSDVPPRRFVAFNALGALLWAAVIGAIGWSFGEAARQLLGRLHHLEGWLLAGLLLSALLAKVVAHWRQARRGE